jgi:hypothetical protein
MTRDSSMEKRLDNRCNRALQCAYMSNTIGHRFNLYIRRDMWDRLKRFQKAREKDVQSRVWLSDVIQAALDKYLPAEKGR